MKMNKRILSLISAVALAATLSGCVANKESNSSSKHDEDKSISESSDKFTKSDKSDKNNEPNNESSIVSSADESSTESSALPDNESSSSDTSDAFSEPNDNISTLDIASKYFETDNGRVLMKTKSIDSEWLNEAYAAHPEINYTSGYKNRMEPSYSRYSNISFAAYMNLNNGTLKYSKKDFAINPTDVEIRNLCPGLTENQYSIFYCIFAQLRYSMYEQTADEILNDYQIDVSTLEDYSVAINMSREEEQPDDQIDVLRIGMFTAKNENDAIEIMDKLLVCKDASLLNDNEKDNAWVIVRKANVIYFAQFFDNIMNPVTDVYEVETDYDQAWASRVVFLHLAHIINIDENTGVVYSSAKFIADKYLEGVELIGYDEAVSEASHYSRW